MAAFVSGVCFCGYSGFLMMFFSRFFVAQGGNVCSPLVNVADIAGVLRWDDDSGLVMLVFIILFGYDLRVFQIKE